MKLNRHLFPLLIVLVVALFVVAACESDDSAGTNSDTAADVVAGDDSTTPADDSTTSVHDLNLPPADTTMPNQERIDEAVAACEAFSADTGVDYSQPCGQPDNSGEHADCNWFACTYCNGLIANLTNCQNAPAMCLGGESAYIYPPCDAEMALCVLAVDCSTMDVPAGSGEIGVCQTASFACPDQYK
jgi:hypothetical protein